LTDGQKQGYRSAQQFLTNDQEQPPTRETQMTVTEDRPTTVAGRREAARRDPASGYAATDTTITRLCDLSAGRSHEAYADIPWDDTGHELSPADPRLQLPEFEPIAQTAWYRGLPKHEKSVVGAWKMATMLRVGADFENLLQQGLLARSLSLPLGVPEFRYAHTEVSEESQHTMMFLEVVSRIGVPATGMPRYVVRALEAVIRTVARRDPALFFLGVLAGEDPIDRAQRRWLAAGVAHPTVERVLRIHVTEESRHVSYARVSVTRDVPKLDDVRAADVDGPGDRRRPRRPDGRLPDPVRPGVPGGLGGQVAQARERGRADDTAREADLERLRHRRSGECHPAHPTRDGDRLTRFLSGRRPG
jgi:hypothetical protein